MKHMPNVISRVLGAQPEIETAVIKSLNNQVLMSALQYEPTKTLKEIYTDIDFFLGRISTRFLFELDFKSSNVSATLTIEQWQGFKEVWTTCEQELREKIFTKRPDVFERKCVRRQKMVKRAVERITHIDTLLHKKRSEAQSLEDEQSQAERRLKESLNKSSGVALVVL
jgi:hypothetical protein